MKTKTILALSLALTLPAYADKPGPDPYDQMIDNYIVRQQQQNLINADDARQIPNYRQANLKKCRAEFEEHGWQDMNKVCRGYIARPERAE